MITQALQLAIIPKDIPAAELKRLLMVPETVWNALNLDKNSDKKQGQLPKLLQDQVKTVPAPMKAPEKILYLAITIGR